MDDAPGWSPESGGRAALERHAAAASALLDDLERLAPATAAGAFADAATRLAPGLLRIGGAEDVAFADGWRTSVTDPAVRAVLEFAEQFVLDVGSLTDEQRGAAFPALGSSVLAFVQALWVSDFVGRARQALDALFGADETLPAPRSSGASELWPAIEDYLRTVGRMSALDPVTTEVVRLRGARAHRCRLCQSLRNRTALLAGATDETFAAIDGGPEGSLDERHRAALAFVDAMVWQPGTIPAEAVAGIRHWFTPAEAVELVLDVTRNASNKIAVAFNADAPHEEAATSGRGYEIYDIDADGEPVYGLTLEEV